MTFNFFWKCFGFLPAKVPPPSGYMWAREFFKGIGSTGPARDNERVKGGGGEGVGGARWRNLEGSS